MNDWRPSATRPALALRAACVAQVRAFFAAQGVLEVETPMLSAAAPTDPHIHGLTTEVTGLGRRWLHTSPEFHMKRLLAAGVGDCYQLARVFRDEEHGRLHSPEFTLLEWYRVGWDDHRLMQEVDTLVRTVLEGHRALGPTVVIRYEEALAMASDEEIAALGQDDEDLIMAAVVTPKLGRDGPCFVTDYPAEKAALARLRQDDPRFAGRFELFIGGLELANGYHELADAAEQRRRFEADNRARMAAGRPAMPVDEDLLAALASGLPECAGVALGFDRLVLLALGGDKLRDVLSFAP